MRGLGKKTEEERDTEMGDRFGGRQRKERKNKREGAKRYRGQGKKKEKGRGCRCVMVGPYVET